MASSSTLQMPAAIVLVLALALLLQCLGSGDSDSCGPEAASEFALDVGDDEASLMQLGDQVVRRRLHDGGASADAVADREEDGKQRQQQRWNAAAEEAATASVAASPAASLATNTNLAAASSSDAILPVVMAAFVNISLQQDSATDAQLKAAPLLHTDTLSGISLVSKTIQDVWHKVAFGAKDSAAQETSAGHFGLTLVIFGVLGITLVFLFFNCWADRLDRTRPRNISSIPGRIGSPQPARQVTLQQPATHWWHPEPSAGKAVEEAGVSQSAQYSRSSGSHSQQGSSEHLRKPILNPQTSPSIGLGWQTWTSPSAGSGEQDTRLPAQYVQAPSSSKQCEPLLPELHGAIVPANRKFIVNVPPLLNLPPRGRFAEDLNESTKTVTTNHGEPLFLIKLSRPTPSGREAVVIEEYFSISLPDEIDKELLICTFGRPRGPQLQCEIHKSDGLGHSTLFGVMYEEPANSGVVPYTLFLASGKRLLTVMVNGKVKDRQIKIWDFNRPGGEVAAAVPGDTGEEPYKVECYPHSDVILSVIAMTIVDRLAAAGK